MRSLFLALPALLLPALAAAQAFPDAPEDWSPLPCQGGPMTDLHADEAGALGERDIVGDVTHPAGMRALDPDFLYLRLRLDADPAPGAKLRPFGWGFELDLDGDTTTYEVLILVAGNGEQVVLHRNTTTTLPDDPNDPADDPAVATYAFATHGRSVAAPGSSFGGNGDFFLELALPWADLAKVGLTPTTPLLAWAASSSTTKSLNGDFACWDDAGGDPTLTGIAPPTIVLDPDQDTDGDGFTDTTEVSVGTDPRDPASFPQGMDPDATLVEGGPGACAVAPGAGRGGAAALLALAGLALLLGGGRCRGRHLVAVAILLLALAALGAGCGGGDPGSPDARPLADGGSPDGGSPDGGPADASPPTDGATADAGGPDAGPVDPADADIRDLQTGAIPSGTAVTVTDVVVTARRDLASSSSIFLQEPGGSPEHSGIFLFVDLNPAPPFTLPNPGDLVTVTATVGEFTRANQPGSRTNLENATALAITGTAAIPAPVVVPEATLADPVAGEPWEGVLVRVEGVTVAEVGSFGELTLAGGLKVDDRLFAYTQPPVGTTYSYLVGPLDWDFGAARILPRSADDMVVAP